MGFRTTKRRYQAAFDAYNEIMKRNAERVLAGEKPSEAELERETAAFNALSEARMQLFAALAPQPEQRPGDSPLVDRTFCNKLSRNL